MALQHTIPKQYRVLLELHITQRQLVIYPMDSAIHSSNNWAGSFVTLSPLAASEHITGAGGRGGGTGENVFRLKGLCHGSEFCFAYFLFFSYRLYSLCNLTLTQKLFLNYVNQGFVTKRVTQACII